MPKKHKKLNLRWKFEKIYLLEKFSVKNVFPQKVPLEFLSPVLITLLTFFRQKSLFSTEFLKNLPPPPAPRSEKTYQTEHFSRKFFFLEKLIWTDKDTILTFCFQSSKNICRVSREKEKVLKTLIQTKNDRLPKKTLQIFRIQFWQSCWNFSKRVRNFAPKFYKNKLLNFRKSYPIASIFLSEKFSMKKLL